MNPLKLFDVVVNLSCLALLLIITIFVLSFIPVNVDDVIIGENEDVNVLLEDVTKKAEENPLLAKGKMLFKNNCANCHNKNMKDDLSGPALKGVEERWRAYPKEDLYNWIRNSQLMVAEGHPQAVEVWNEWSPTVMNAFPNFTDEEIEAILAYVER